MKNMSLSTKMFVGFGMVILMLIIAGGCGVFSLARGNGKLSYYVSISNNSMLAATIQYTLTDARRQAARYRETGDEKDKTGTDEQIAATLELLAKAQNDIKNEQRAVVIDELDAGMQTYKEGFAEFAAKSLETRTTYDAMGGLGSKMVENITGIQHAAENEHDYYAASLAGNVLSSMLMARLFMVKHYISAAQEDYDQFTANAGQMDKDLAVLSGTLKSPARQQLCKETSTSLGEYVTTAAACHAAMLARDSVKTDKLDPIRDLNAKITDMKTEFQKELEGLAGDSIRANVVAMSIVIAVVLAAIIVAVIISLVITRSIKKPIISLASAAKTMSHGDYTLDMEMLKVMDEIGQMTEAFIEMKNSTRETIRLVTESATSVASSSQELSAGADETSKAIQQVATTVQEVAKGSQETTTSVSQAQANLEQTAQAVEGVSKDIEEVAAYATQAAAQGEEGRKAADNAVQIINRAARSVQDTTKVVHNLGDKTQRIAEFIGIITGIADQTNLLALNAAIEAARAGEAGRGFAVVAEEVRKLAEESNTAAGNITDLVKGIENEMATALQAMERSDKEVMDGAKTVEQTSQMLGEIVHGVQVINEKVQNISAATEQINAQTGEVVELMQSVASVAEQNAAASEEVSSATEEQTASMEEIGASANTLANLAQDLQLVVAKFKVD
jgi:methyl-accepting chemotaxis protein